MPRKDPDYSKLKALHDSILDYIGDAEDVGEHPDLPANDKNDAGTSDFGAAELSDGKQEPLLDFIGNEQADGKDEQGESADEDDGKKKKKGSELAMYGAMLSRSMGK